MKPARQTPTTTLVEEALRSTDDFVRCSTLVAKTGRSLEAIRIALRHLRQHQVVDVIVGPDGVGWWYPRPSADDNRCFRKVEMPCEITRKQPGTPRKGTKREIKS